MSAPYVVSSEDRGRVRLLVLDRPDKLNAFTPDGYRALTAALDVAVTDEDVALCVLTGRGRAFSAGVDLDVMAAPGGSAALGRAFDPLLDRLATFPKPLLAAVNGPAVGFGATILLHCDIVVVDEDANIRMPFIALGTAAEAGSSLLLPGRVGMQWAQWLVLSGRGLSAVEAVEAGFALQCAPRGEALEVVMAMAQQIATHRTEALVANKQLLRGDLPARVVERWREEKATMAALAQRLGPIAWPGNRR